MAAARLRSPRWCLGVPTLRDSMEASRGCSWSKRALNDRGTVAVVNSTFDRGEKSVIWLHQGQHFDERRLGR